MITICAWCPDFDKNDARNANASHGICPSCVARVEGEWLTDDHGRPVAPLASNVTPERPAGPWDANGR